MTRTETQIAMVAGGTVLGLGLLTLLFWPKKSAAAPPAEPSVPSPPPAPQPQPQPAPPPSPAMLVTLAQDVFATPYQPVQGGGAAIVNEMNVMTNSSPGGPGRVFKAGTKVMTNPDPEFLGSKAVRFTEPQSQTDWVAFASEFVWTQG